MNELNVKPPSHRVFPKFFWSILIIILIIFGILFAKAYNFSTKIFGHRVSFIKRIEQLVFNNGSKLTGEDQNQINILLLGYGGAGHDGPYLSDSMILASIKPADNQVLLTSIPRDLYWSLPEGAKKINNAFADGVGKKLNYEAGGDNADQAVSTVSGQNVPYYVALDFQGFVDAVNRVGGLDVSVERTFTDNQYPNDATGGYLPPQTFQAGQQHMDGERALIFARSRHAEGIEGSDFARSKRQEKILQAFSQKVRALNIFKNSSTLNALSNILADHFHTNLEPNEALHLIDMIRSSGFQITSQSLDQDTGLICPKILDDGQYVLIPCDGITDQQIKNFFANGFEAAALSSEHASIILENSGTDNTTYQNIKAQLTAAGAVIYEVPYRGIPLSQSVLYEVNSEPLTETFIENKLNIKRQPKPKQLIAKADLVLIVGGSR